ncbi:MULTISPECIES: ROK family protein [unclassified Lentimonas]|uniref:ROK family protein n=1 Tax=unclassified Lentimonas TaxID=2630993 RepID=UPI001327E9AC|nr:MULTISPECIES: ROK family protein [unclassified Lentimonas]CAA6680175.1 transcriptional repressor/ROK family [Lentimonas sp. CC4]CAA6687403.1 transcriptional repressor/ROK family [Lentimonas sp. CC6]CAA7076057.1 transcriptional repressor/ROK family [Lentimonas sp. CC4]CAA7171984.1 transcriptional repressor/ROK family [Lentimonas sp. CC21]CAA7181108.1 transcriptional repressor/ROK family [Lentimonas sp. CC8]
MREKQTTMYLGVDIGGTKCAVCVGSDAGEVLVREVVPTTDCEATVTWIVATAKRLAETYGDELKAVGISCGSPMDSQAGLILSPPNLPDWERVEIVRHLQEATDLPAYLMNDGNAGALAEGLFGAGRGCLNYIFLTCGTGMGAGIVVHGRVLEGACGMAGEVGHVRLSADGPIGFHKSGSFEGWCSGGGFAQYAGMSAKEAGALAVQGDARALEWFTTFGEYLGKGTAMLVDVLNPERIVIGGIFPRAEQWIRAEMEAALEREGLAANVAACEIMPAELGERIGDLAALAIALYGLNGGSL